MLKDPNTPSINDIVTIKLVSGEEIIGKLIDRSLETITLSKPVRAELHPVGPNQMGLLFVPMLGSVSTLNQVQIPFTSMTIRPVKTGPDSAARYLEATTGLVAATPEQTKIITA